MNKNNSDGFKLLFINKNTQMNWQCEIDKI